MDKKIITNFDHRVTRVAVMEEGRLAEIYVERPLQHRVVGNIYKGTVVNVLPGIQAAFVDIGLERNTFLYVDDVSLPKKGAEGYSVFRPPIEQLLRVGQEIMAQVIKEPFGSKGARLTGEITIPGRYLVLVPDAGYVGVSRRIEDAQEKERLRNLAESIRPPGMGVIVRTVAEGVDESLLAQDLELLQYLWSRIQSRFAQKKAPCILYQDLALISRIARDLLTDEVSVFLVDNYHEYEKVLDVLEYTSPELKSKVELYSGEEPIFEKFGLEKEIQKALDRAVWLKCGGYLVFDETEALTVIDINTGRNIGKRNLAETVFKTNMEAAEEIARQIRLRDIGGIIIVDFIDMNEEVHRQKVLHRLNEAIKNDRTRTYVLGITSLGLVEMTRKKVRQDLNAFLHQACPYCDGYGRVLTPVVVCTRVERELKKLLPREKEDAVLIETHPEVAAVLIGTGGSNLKKMESEVGKYIFIRGNGDIHLEKFRIVATGTREEIANKAFPVSSGETLEVLIEESHSSNPTNGIARFNGFVLDVNGAGEYVGQKVNVEVKEVNRTFARATLT